MPLLPATPDDLPFLWEMLAQAAFPTGGTHPPELLADDHIQRYLDGWGRPGDAGLVAWEEGRRAGASWIRLLPPERPGYGFVDAATPELSVAVVDGARGRGVGRALVVGTLDLAAAHDHPQVCLSVARANEVAAGLYRSIGFVDVAADAGGSMTMVAAAAPAPPSHDGAIGPARLATEADGPALVRLRHVMFGSFAAAPDVTWVGPFLRAWPVEAASDRWVATLVESPDGRPIASAIANLHHAPPGPGRPQGRIAHLGSVATEAPWRRRGAARAAVTALVTDLDRRGVEATTLTASPDGAGLYRALGFAVGNGQAMRRPHP